ncbi:MAG: serine hydrolase domain-containing protein [Planctomycetaceae bacterium]
MLIGLNEVGRASDLHQALPQASAHAERGIREGLHKGMQMYVSRAGRVIADGGIGESRDGVPMTADTLNLWVSAGKPLTAVAVMRLVEAGRVGLDEPVAAFIPPFADHGKERVTVKHLLTHTAGLRSVVTGWPNDAGKEIVARICRTRLRDGWAPGQRAAYDRDNSWFILGEIVRRLEGRPIDEVVRDDLMRPLGMRDSWMAMPPDVLAAYGDRFGHVWAYKPSGLKLMRSHDPLVAAAPSPGATCRGPIRELGFFYEMLLNHGRRNNVRILRPDTVALMTRRHREGLFDETFEHTIDFGLGLIIDSNRYGADTVPYGFGKHCSPQAFGHGGARSSIGFADPKYGLVVTAVANGCPPEPIHNDRFRRLVTFLYEDLGLC